MFDSLETTTSKSNTIDLTLAVKQHILTHRDKSVSYVRHTEPFKGSYLTVSQIKEVFDLSRKIGAKMDEIATENPKILKSELVTALNKEFDDELVADCVDARLADATSEGTYSAYIAAIGEVNSDNLEK